MSVWSQFNGEVILSGCKYDGKGFGLKSLWYPDDGHGVSVFYVLNNGKLNKHHSSSIFRKAWDSMNVPYGSEGGSIIDITESKLTGNICISFDGNLRDYSSKIALRTWIIQFLRQLQEEGWTVECKFQYGMDSAIKDEISMTKKNQKYFVETRREYCSDNKINETCWVRYLSNDKELKLLYEDVYEDC